MANADTVSDVLGAPATRKCGWPARTCPTRWQRPRAGGRVRHGARAGGRGAAHVGRSEWTRSGRRSPMPCARPSRTSWSTAARWSPGIDLGRDRAGTLTFPDAQPAELVEQLERHADLPPGSGERFSGYGVMGLPFRSGHVLGLRRFPASSIGPGYRSVWHRDPGGRWTFYQDQPAELACTRSSEPRSMRSVRAGSRIDWTGPRRLEVPPVTSNGPRSCVDSRHEAAQHDGVGFPGVPGGPRRCWPSCRGSQGGDEARAGGLGR